MTCTTAGSNRFGTAVAKAAKAEAAVGIAFCRTLRSPLSGGFVRNDIDGSVVTDHANVQLSGRLGPSCGKPPLSNTMLRVNMRERLNLQGMTMVEVQRVITVSKPVEVVSEYLRDFAHTAAWDPGTIVCTRLDSGPVRVGSEWHNVSEFRGKKTKLAYRLAQMDTGRLIFIGENKTATSTDDLTLSVVPEGTRITYHATIVFNGLAKIAGPFLKREFEKIGDEIVIAMRQTLIALESEPHSPSC